MEKELTSWLIRLRSIASICASAEIGPFGNAPASRSELEAALQSALMNQFRERVSEDQFNKVMDQVFERSLSPLEAVRC